GCSWGIRMADCRTLVAFVGDQHNVRGGHCQCFAFGAPIRKMGQQMPARAMCSLRHPQQTTEPDIVAPVVRFLTRTLAVAAAVGALSSPVRAGNEALLLIDAETGKVLQAENATYPWYPASTSKLMTTYVTLQAVKAGRISMDTLLTVSPNAVAQTPSKMGFHAGVTVTVDNALKMLLVHSANDIAVVLAEGV